MDEKKWSPYSDYANFGSSIPVTGINWTWCTFTDEESAVAFEAKCRESGYETRGVYPPQVNYEVWSVRFR